VRSKNPTVTMLVVAGAFVAGFAPTPSDDLAGRGIEKDTPEMCEREKCVLAGPNPKGLKGKCVGIGYKNTVDRTDKWFEQPFAIDLETRDEDWCYQNAGGPTTCETYRRGCNEDRTSTFCESYQRMTTVNKDGITTCPPWQSGAVDNFCTIQLPELKKLPEGAWCGSIKDEDTCEESVYQGEGEGKTDLPLMSGTTMYGRCIWSKDNKCQKATRPGYGDEVYFCQNSCKVVGDREALPVNTKCGKGPIFDEPKDRLFSAKVCESYMSIVQVVGRPDTFFPCVAQQPGGKRDEVEQGCFQECEDENPAKPCIKACNCVESTRVKEWTAGGVPGQLTAPEWNNDNPPGLSWVKNPNDGTPIGSGQAPFSPWENVPGCSPTEMQCCKNTKDGYTCEPCPSKDED